MGFELGAASRGRLARVHADLRRVVERAITKSDVDFRVLEGMRTRARQKALVAAGPVGEPEEQAGEQLRLGPLPGRCRLAPAAECKRERLDRRRRHCRIAVERGTGGGRHLRLHFAKGGYNYAGIFFSCTPAELGVRIGQWADVAFTPQINEFRGRPRLGSIEAPCLSPVRGLRRIEA